LDSGESGTFPKIKTPTSGISEQQEENSMIFAKVTFTLDGI
jgi:hypothetical protein